MWLRVPLLEHRNSQRDALGCQLSDSRMYWFGSVLSSRIPHLTLTEDDQRDQEGDIIPLSPLCGPIITHNIEDYPAMEIY